MNRERVQMLRNMMAGIPESRVFLDDTFTGEFHSSGRPPKPCGAIACIAGWAWIYPPFIEAGIRDKCDTAVWAAPEFFGIPAQTFAPKVYGERGTHKEIALRRLDKILGKSKATACPTNKQEAVC